VLILIPISICLLELIGVINILDKNQLISGGLHNQGALTNYLVSLAPLSFSILILEKKCHRMITILSLDILVIVIFFVCITFSRSAMIACSISFIYIISLNLKVRDFVKILWQLRNFRTIFLFAILIALSVSAYLLYHFKKDSADGRLFIWKNCIDIIHGSPVFGQGYGSFIKSYCWQQINYFKGHSFLASNFTLLADNVYFAFNDYLQIIVELGIVGLVLFSLPFLYIFKKLKGTQNILIIGCKACIISILICGLSSYPIETPQNFFLLFLFLAFISANTESVLKITVKKSLAFSIVLLLITTYIGIIQIYRFTACMRWQKAFNHTHQSDGEELKKYRNIYQILEYDPNFLYNYGMVLNINYDFKMSAIVFNKVKELKPSYNMFINLGKAYENLNNDSLAEVQYKFAALLIPNRFMPRYSLLRLYMRTNQKVKATVIAKEIECMKIKVYSNDAVFFKEQALDYINNECK
jgi:hypothetical protein